MEHTVDYRAWRQAEITRSAVEAAHTPEASLRVAPATRRRYTSPDADTPYPLEYAYHLAGDLRGRRTLDFGCGSGANAVLLADHGGAVTGIDISLALLSLAGRRAAVNGVDRQARFVLASAHEIPLASASFDLVFGIAILHHLDLELAAAETHRLLKPGGRAIFQEPVRGSRALRLARALVPSSASDVSPFERPLSPADLDRVAAGFIVGRCRAFRLPHLTLAEHVPVLRERLDLLYRLDRAATRRLPWLERYTSIRVIELIKP